MSKTTPSSPSAMPSPSTRGELKKLVTCAMLIAVAAVLSMVKLFQFPQAGAVTLASMVPIIIIAYLFGTRWGITSSIVYATLQLLLDAGIYTPPTSTFIAWVGVIFIDYIIAFGFLGFGRLISRNVIIGGACVVAIRFVCHLISGVIIWGVYAPEGQGIWAYSAIYNGGYMGPELVITVAVLAVLAKVKQIPWENRTPPSA